MIFQYLDFQKSRCTLKSRLCMYLKIDQTSQIVLRNIQIYYCNNSKFFVSSLLFKCFNYLSVMPDPGGARGPLASPIFGGSVNPIPTGEGRLSPPITTGTPNVFHLPASLCITTALGTLFCATDVSQRCLARNMATYTYDIEQHWGCQ